MTTEKLIHDPPLMPKTPLQITMTPPPSKQAQQNNDLDGKIPIEYTGNQTELYEGLVP